MDALIPRNPAEHFSSLKHRLGWFTHSTSKKIWRINNLELQTLTPSVWAPTRFPTRDVIFYYNKENYLLKNTKMCLSSNPWHCPTDKNTHFLDDHLANPFLKKSLWLWGTFFDGFGNPCSWSKFISLVRPQNRLRSD